jgi:predicted Ser/Thr protein kinase
LAVDFEKAEVKIIPQNTAKTLRLMKKKPEACAKSFMYQCGI